jgi:hypothetical protein
MKKVLKADQVSYNPKTDEYTIEDNFQPLGTLCGFPIFVERVGYGDLLMLETWLSNNKWI